MKSKILLINVDVEAHRGNDPINDLIYGKVCGGEYGIGAIMDLCDRYHVMATFFVDFAEVNTWGYDKIQKVCQDILIRGHDVQLHIHPEHFGNWSKQEFSQYTYEEQKKMIVFGVEQYVQIVGRKPIAFRAGKYSINENTLKVLSELGIPIDSSFVKNNKWCKLNTLITSTNVDFNCHGIHEIPVTVFKERYFNRLPWDKYYVFDINTMTKFEFRELYKKYADSELQIITLFMHSFSFLKRYNDDLNLKPNIKDMNFFEYILKYVTERNDFSIKTFSSYYESNRMQTLTTLDFTPKIDSFVKSAIGIFNRYRKASIRSKQFRKYFYMFYGALTLAFLLLMIIML